MRFGDFFEHPAPPQHTPTPINVGRANIAVSLTDGRSHNFYITGYYQRGYGVVGAEQAFAEWQYKTAETQMADIGHGSFVALHMIRDVKVEYAEHTIEA